MMWAWQSSNPKKMGAAWCSHPSVNLGIISCPKTRACHLKSAALTGSEPFKWLASANNSAQPLHLKQRLRCNTFGKGTISLAQSTTRFIYNLHAVRVSLLNNHSREEDKAIIAATFILFLHEFSFIKSVWRLHASSSTPRFCDLREKSPISPARGMTPTARLGTWTWDLWRLAPGVSLVVTALVWMWVCGYESKPFICIYNHIYIIICIYIYVWYSYTVIPYCQFGGMNIHLPALLMFGSTGCWHIPICAIDKRYYGKFINPWTGMYRNLRCPL